MRGISAIIDQQVWSITWDTIEDATVAKLDDFVLDLFRGDIRTFLETEKVGGQASHMRRSHGSTRDGVSGVLVAIPNREDILPRSKYIDTFTIVRERRTFIEQGGGTNSDGLLSTGRRVVAGILIVITYERVCPSLLNVPIMLLGNLPAATAKMTPSSTAPSTALSKDGDFPPPSDMLATAPL